MSLENIHKVVAISARARRKDPKVRAKLRENTIKTLKELTEDAWEDVEDEDEIESAASEAEEDTESVMSLGDIADDILNDLDKQKKLSRDSFVRELTYAMSQEVMDLDYDYFAFTRSTWRLLTAIQDACMPHLLRYIDDKTAIDVLASPNGAIVVPQALISLACDPRKDHTLTRVKGAFHPLAVDTGGMKIAAAVMKDFIEREGDAFVKRMKDKELRKRETAEYEGQQQRERELGGFSSAVGKIDGISNEESAKKLKAVTIQEARKRAEAKLKVAEEAGKLAEEAKEQHKASKKARQRANRKAKKEAAIVAGAMEGNGEAASGSDLSQAAHANKENMQPQVEEADD